MVPLEPGVGNAMEEHDRFPRSRLDIVPGNAFLSLVARPHRQSSGSRSLHRRLPDRRLDQALLVGRCESDRPRSAMRALVRDEPLDRLAGRVREALHTVAGSLGFQRTSPTPVVDKVFRCLGAAIGDCRINHFRGDPGRRNVLGGSMKTALGPGVGRAVMAAGAFLNGFRALSSRCHNDLL